MEKIIYGTAWKKERTKDLVVLAIKTGFRAIDTACQPKHYNEPMVGLGIKESGIPRPELFIQTKFTSLDGQDPKNIPYDPNAPLEKQVVQSIAISCKNLHTDYLDSYILHSPMRKYSETLKVWKVMEDYYNDGILKNLGISNCYDLSYLQALYKDVEIKPKFVQNRFYNETNYDKELRKWCDQQNILYQSFWTLTANPNLLNHPVIIQLAGKYQLTVEQLFFSYVSHMGIIPLTGTNNPLHMHLDLEAMNVELNGNDIFPFCA